MHTTYGYLTGHGILGPEGYTLPLRPMPCLQHPHLQLRGVEASGSDGLPLLRGITLEAGAAEVLAVMATTEKEGTQIVETIAGRRRIKRGDILLNGRSVSARTLRYFLIFFLHVRFVVVQTVNHHACFKIVRKKYLLSAS